MLIMKVGMLAGKGKTNEALKKAIELSELGKQVLFITNEETHNYIYDRIVYLTKKSGIELEVLLKNICCVHSDFDRKRLENLTTSKDSENFSIILDLGIDYSDIRCNQDLYVFYQIRRM